LTSQIPRKIKQ